MNKDTQMAEQAQIKWAEAGIAVLRLYVAAMAGLSVASLAAATQVWSVPFPRALLLTSSVAFGMASLWALPFITVSDGLLMYRRAQRRMVAWMKTLYAAIIFGAVYMVLSHAGVGSHALFALGECATTATAWQCDVTSASSVEEKQRLNPLLAKYTRLPWVPW